MNEEAHPTLSSEEKAEVESLRFVAEEVFLDRCRGYPHVFMRTSDLATAVRIVQFLSFAGIDDSPEGQRVEVPDGVALRIFLMSSGLIRFVTRLLNKAKVARYPYLALVGNLTPSQMSEVVDAGSREGAEVIQAGFMTTQEKNWRAVFRKIVQMGKQSPRFDLFAPDEFQIEW